MQDKPITSYDPISLVDQVEARYGPETAANLAAVIRRNLEAERAEHRARMDELVTQYPALKSIKPKPR
jgi:hypothetical protein